MTRQISYTYDELIACANGDLFGPGNARLPAPPMLMFDRITHISETGGAHDKGEIRAEFLRRFPVPKSQMVPRRPTW